jgi:hypothetical protein
MAGVKPRNWEEGFFRGLVNRFGLVLLLVAAIVVWDRGSSTDVYLENAYWMLPVLAVVSAVSGISAYNTFRPSHHQSHAGAAAVVWAGAVAIIGTVAWLVILIAAASHCVALTPPSTETLGSALAVAGSDESAYRSLLAVSTSPEWLSQTDGCNASAARLYAAFSPWQTGIGAAIGLFGVAWSTMYRSVYEDWKSYQAPTFSEHQKDGG